jgi:hypothetical protein
MNPMSLLAEENLVTSSPTSPKKAATVLGQMVHLYQEAIRRRQALFLFSPKAFFEELIKL